MKIYHIMPALALLALGACRISKEVTVPTASLPVAYRNEASTGDTSNIDDLPCKSFFTDAALQQLIDTAIVKNYDMQIALTNIEAANLQFKRVKWDYVPEADLNVGQCAAFVGSRHLG